MSSPGLIEVWQHAPELVDLKRWIGHVELMRLHACIANLHFYPHLPLLLPFLVLFKHGALELDLWIGWQDAMQVVAAGVTAGTS